MLTGVKPPELPEPEEFRSRGISTGSGTSGYGGSAWDSRSSSDVDSPWFWDSDFDDR